MAYKKIRKLAKDSSIEKKRFKLYKSGRNWMVAGLATITFGLAQLGFSQVQSVHADTTSDETSATSANTDIQEKAVTLSTAAASAQSSVVQNGNNSGSGSSSAVNSSSAAQSSTSADSSVANSSDTAQSSASTSSATPQVKTFVDATYQVAAASDASGTTATLPDGFSVSDPDYPANVFHYAEDSEWYTFAQVNKVTFAINRNDMTTIQIGLVSGTAGALAISGEKILDTASNDAKAVTMSGLQIFNNEDSIAVVGTLSTLFDVLQYPKGTTGSWGSFSFFKPIKQEQTTKYVDQNGKEIADEVKMTGLSGQKYNTASSAELEDIQRSIVETLMA